MTASVVATSGPTGVSSCPARDDAAAYNRVAALTTARTCSGDSVADSTSCSRPATTPDTVSPAVVAGIVSSDDDIHPPVLLVHRHRRQTDRWLAGMRSGLDGELVSVPG